MQTIDKLWWYFLLMTHVKWKMKNLKWKIDWDNSNTNRALNYSLLVFSRRDSFGALITFHSSRSAVIFFVIRFIQAAQHDSGFRRSVHKIIVCNENTDVRNAAFVNLEKYKITLLQFTLLYSAAWFIKCRWLQTQSLTMFLSLQECCCMRRYGRGRKVKSE